MPFSADGWRPTRNLLYNVDKQASRVPETRIARSLCPRTSRFYHLNGVSSKYCVSLTLDICKRSIGKEKKIEGERKERFYDFLGASYWKTTATSRRISRLFGIQRVHKVDCAQPCSFCIMPERDKHPGRWLFRSCHGCFSYGLYIVIYSPLLNADGKIERIHRAVCIIRRKCLFIYFKFESGCLNFELVLAKIVNVKSHCIASINKICKNFRFQICLNVLSFKNAIFIKLKIIIILIWKRYTDTIYINVMGI